MLYELYKNTKLPKSTHLLFFNVNSKEVPRLFEIVSNKHRMEDNINKRSRRFCER